ncbi:hypothetical protein FMUAM8_49050 [Nocardia cyriacigeorgica]|nr:hypothetical protein FMUAM8_49050 [Nocardia cyriacigeorgica]
MLDRAPAEEEAPGWGTDLIVGAQERDNWQWCCQFTTLRAGEAEVSCRT